LGKDGPVPRLSGPGIVRGDYPSQLDQARNRSPVSAAKLRRTVLVGTVNRDRQVDDLSGRYPGQTTEQNLVSAVRFGVGPPSTFTALTLWFNGTKKTTWLPALRPLIACRETLRLALTPDNPHLRLRPEITGTVSKSPVPAYCPFSTRFLPFGAPAAKRH
jgi:hypothetical protein